MFVGRIGNFGFMHAIAVASARQGWSLDLGDSAFLKVPGHDGRMEVFPALVLSAGHAHEANLTSVEQFWANQG